MKIQRQTLKSNGQFSILRKPTKKDTHVELLCHATGCVNSRKLYENSKGVYFLKEGTFFLKDFTKTFVYVPFQIIEK